MSAVVRPGFGQELTGDREQDRLLLEAIVGRELENLVGRLSDGLCIPVDDAFEGAVNGCLSFILDHFESGRISHAGMAEIVTGFADAIKTQLSKGTP